MPKNKQALIRYLAIDKCLSNRKIRYTGEKILEVVNKTLEKYDNNTNGVSRSQFYADLAYMRSSDGWNVEIETTKHGKNRYIRYHDENFSINKMPFTELEIKQLSEGINVFKQFSGMPQFEWMEDIAIKLQQGMERAKSNPTIAFDENKFLEGIKWFGILYNAIQYSIVLKISYKSFKMQRAETYLIHPYHLKQYNNRWFVFGLNAKLDGKISNLALDRIVSITETETVYIPNTQINFTEYFEDIIGVTRPEEQSAQKIELLISPERAGYVLTKPIHGSQKKRKHDESGLYITLDLIENLELLQVILSFGSDIEILSPESLRSKIERILSNALKKYNN